MTTTQRKAHSSPAVKTAETPPTVGLSVMNAFDYPLLILDRERQILNINRAGEELAGRSAEHIRGTFFGDAMGWDDETCARICPASFAEQPDPDRTAEDLPCTLPGETRRVVFLRRSRILLDKDQPGVLLALESTRRWEQRYRDLLSGAPLLFLEMDRDGVILDGAGALSEVLGVRAETIEHHKLAQLTASDQRAYMRNLWTRVRKGEPARGIELRLTDAAGATHPFWVSIFPFVDDLNAVVAVRAIAIDLSAQKSLAYALEAAEERFAVLFRESSDPILMLSMNGDILLANPAFERINGVRSEELFAGEKSWADFVHPEDLDNLLAAIRRSARDNQSGVAEYRIRSIEGGFLWFEQTQSILHNESGVAKGIVAVARNIDRYKRREQALNEEAEIMRRRHARAQLLVSELKELFTLTSSEDQPLEAFLNGVCDLLRDFFQPYLVFLRTQSDQGALTVWGRRTPHDWPADRSEAWLRPLCERVLTERAPIVCEHVDPEADDAPSEAFKALGLRAFLGAPLTDSTGHNWGVIGLLDHRPLSPDNLDIELLAIAALQVAARLWFDDQEAKKRELETHLRQAQKMEAVGMLAGGIAHDFNNVLSGILGFSSYLLSKVEIGSDLYRDLEMIEQSAVRGADMTRQLLAFARRKHFAKEPVNLNKVIDEALGLLRHSLNKNIAVHTRLAPDLPPVMGDYGQLHQVMMNLCINAAEAMAERGGDLTLSTGHRALRDDERKLFSGGIASEYVCVRVEDTGIGMSPDVLAHVFDPFYTTKGTHGGSGLGLAIVYGIVTNHNGEIRVQSEAGKGTAFDLYLPACRSTETPPSDVTQPQDLGGVETILVVEDEAIVRHMVTEVLKSRGYKVVAAESGQKGVESLEALDGRIDLVLLDMIMPGMDGEATFYAMRKRYPEARVLLTSGFSREDLCERLIAEGALGLVHKPYKSENLLSMVRKALDGDPAS